jgi:hypothetical protein
VLAAAPLPDLDVPGWSEWLALALAAWLLVSVPVGFLVARLIALRRRPCGDSDPKPPFRVRLPPLSFSRRSQP